jgi:hypothetical protein
VKAFYLSSESVLPIKRNRSTYQVKPFYLSSQTVIPFKCNLYRYIKVRMVASGMVDNLSVVHLVGLYKLKSS